MKLLSVRQPHAHLLRYSNLKRYETREWKTDYRGQIGIHASRWRPTRADIERIREAAGGLSLETLPEDPEAYTYGAVIAVGHLVDVHPITPVLSAEQNPVELAAGFWERPYAWEISDRRVLAEAVPMLGRTKLWNWEPDQALLLLPPLSAPAN